MICAASWTIISSHCADLNSSLIILVSLCRVYFKTDHPYAKLPYYDSVYLLLGIIIVVHEKRYYIRYKRVINFQLASAICFHSLGKEIILRIFFFCYLLCLAILFYSKKSPMPRCLYLAHASALLDALSSNNIAYPSSSLPDFFRFICVSL